jgi:uncharacterized membrane protein YdjX (TVP38/TMEM64 family)
MNSSAKTNPFRILGVVVLLAAISVLAVYGGQWWPSIRHMVSESGSAGFLLFMGMFVVLTVLCFPVSVLGFTAGALYGPWFGLLLLYPSGLLSGTLMFFLGRGLFRDFVQNLVHRNSRLTAVQNAAGEQAVQLNILTRLSPFNFGMASYALAVGRSSFRAYLLGILVILPSMAAQVWIGALAGKSGQLGQEGVSGNRVELIILAVGILFFGILTWHIGKVIRRALAPENPLDNPGDGHRNGSS